MYTTRIPAVKAELQILKCTQFGFLWKKSELKILNNVHNSDFCGRNPRGANSKLYTTRIFAEKIRIANLEMYTTRTFALKTRVANSKMHNSDFCGKNPNYKF